VKALFGEGTDRRDLFGGHGAVNVRTLGAGPSLPPPFTAALACELAAGGHVGRHRQEHDDEIVIIVAGGGVGHVDTIEVSLVPGLVLPLPLGASLELRAHDDGPLQYLIVKAHRPH